MADHLTINLYGKSFPIEIQWEKYGRHENPVLVFLHEGLGSCASWKNIPQILSKATQCNAFAYSRPGYGKSGSVNLPRKINWFHTEALKVLPRILKKADIKNYILVGHSDGGSISAIHGGTSNHGLKGIVSLAAHFFCEPATLEGVRQAKQWYLTGNLRQRLETIHESNTDTAFWGWNDTWLAPRFKYWNIEKYLRKIQVPVLGIQGVDDIYATSAQLDAMTKGLKKKQIHLIENCGHAPHIEKKDEVLQLLTNFIQTCITK
ncbi:MAG: alpha/beta hydrolase [Desulfobacterales bacterium]|nr:alpha/beta hydrolase [Desulfobacterales bacterium]